MDMIQYQIRVAQSWFKYFQSGNFVKDPPSKRKWIEMDRNGFVLFISNPDSDILDPFLSN